MSPQSFFTSYSYPICDHKKESTNPAPFHEKKKQKFIYAKKVFSEQKNTIIKLGGENSKIELENSSSLNQSL